MSGDTLSQTHKQYLAAIIANGASFTSGLSIGWMSPVVSQIIPDQNGVCAVDFCVATSEIPWIATSMSLGGMIFGFFAGPLMGTVGRKCALLVYLMTTVAGWLALTFAWASWMLYLGRVLVGIGFGGCGVIVPIYVGEIAQTAIRGKLLTFKQGFIQAGVVTAFVLGYFLDVASQNKVSLMIVCVLWMIVFCIPESPRFLVFVDRIRDAEVSLKWLRGGKFNIDEEIKETITFQNNKQPKNVRVLFTDAANRKALIVSVGLVAGFQLSGIGAFTFYTASIFQDANISIDPNLAAIYVGAVGLGATLVSSMVIEKVGRRFLLLSSALAMVISCITIGCYLRVKSFNPKIVESWGILPVIALCLFVFANSVGTSPVAYVIMGEIFAQNVKDVAAGITMTSNYILFVAVSLLYPYISGTLGADIGFFVFGACSVVSFFFVTFVVPETKGKSFQEIQDSLKGPSKGK